MLNTLLNQWIAQGDLYQLKKVLKSHHLPTNLPDPNYGKPLYFIAIEYHQQEILEYLLGEKNETIDKV